MLRVASNLQRSVASGWACTASPTPLRSVSGGVAAGGVRRRRRLLSRAFLLQEPLAVEAKRHSALEPRNSGFWQAKATMLRALGRIAAAEEADARAAAT